MVLIMSEPVSQIAALYFMGAPLLPHSSSTCSRTHNGAAQDLRKSRKTKTATVGLVLPPCRDFTSLLCNFRIVIERLSRTAYCAHSPRFKCFPKTCSISIRRAASNSRMQQQHQEVPDTLRPLRRTIAPAPALPTPTTVRMPGPADAGGSGVRGGGDGKCF